jgi:hypothetical protein
VYGNPARVRGYACECGLKLQFRDNRASCGECGRVYARENDIVRKVQA